MLPSHVWRKISSLKPGDLVVEYRGWREEIVSPISSYFPTVSEITSPCATHRDVYLHRVLALKITPSSAMIRGKVLHEVFLSPLRAVIERGLAQRDLTERLATLKNRILREIPADLRRVASRVYDIAASLASSWAFNERKIPVLVEPFIEASSVGLSDFVRPDLVVGLIPVEFVLGDKTSVKRKSLALTAYAMAIESIVHSPVNFGVVARVDLSNRVLRWHVTLLSDDLREKLIEVRNVVARIVATEDDPGKSPNCPESCPWREVCYGIPICSRARIPG